jgi:hypothetical protein
VSEEQFDPSAHLMSLPGKGGAKLYLPVAARVVWFREEHPVEAGWSIQTELIDGSFEKGFAVFVARIVDPEGRILATGTNVETKEGFGDFLMKAETSAIGRALAAAGFGTMGALDEGGVVDAPVDRPRSGGERVQGNGEASFCESCGLALTASQAVYSRNKFQGRALCPVHQKAVAG